MIFMSCAIVILNDMIMIYQYIYIYIHHVKGRCGSHETNPIRAAVYTTARSLATWSSCLGILGVLERMGAPFGWNMKQPIGPSHGIGIFSYLHEWWDFCLNGKCR